VDRAEYEEFRAHNARWCWRVWWIWVCLAVACGYVVGIEWSFAAGFPVAGVLGLLGRELMWHLGKRRWIRRFPEFGGPDVHWRRGSRYS